MNEPVFDQIEPVRNSQHEMAHLKQPPLRCMGLTNGDITMCEIQFENPKSLKKITMLDEIKPMKKMKIDTIVTVRVPMTKKEVTAYVGKPCKDREIGCIACDTWEEWRLNYRYVSVQVNRAEMISLMIRGAI